MTTVYEQFQNLTPQEQAYVRSHPFHAVTIKSAKETAYAETRARFGRNGHNDKSDAFRHCYWSALLARDIGFHNALRFTTAHESSPANVPAEKVMDLHNNAIGLRIGRSGGSDAILSARCYGALMANKLKVMVK